MPVLPAVSATARQAHREEHEKANLLTALSGGPGGAPPPMRRPRPTTRERDGAERDRGQTFTPCAQGSNSGASPCACSSCCPARDTRNSTNAFAADRFTAALRTPAG